MKNHSFVLSADATDATGGTAVMAPPDAPAKAPKPERVKSKVRTADDLLAYNAGLQFGLKTANQAAKRAADKMAGVAIKVRPGLGGFGARPVTEADLADIRDAAIRDFTVALNRVVTNICELSSSTATWGNKDSDEYLDATVSIAGSLGVKTIGKDLRTLAVNANNAAIARGLVQS